MGQGVRVVIGLVRVMGNESRRRGGVEKRMAENPDHGQQDE